MKNHQEFDVIIAGNSLSARMSAALLSKNGYRTLLLGDPLPEEPAWHFSSLFIEHLLAALGGRSCFVSPAPFQVICSGSRVTLHSERPIEEELTREFGRAAQLLAKVLAELKAAGDRLDQLLWENGGLPWSGLKNCFRFRWLCMRRNFAVADLHHLLRTDRAGLTDETEEFLQGVMQGLSLRPTDTLRRGEAALLWSQATRPENLSLQDLNALLEKRFDQFHGTSESLADLEKLHFKGSHFLGGLLRDKGPFRGRFLLVGNLAAVRPFFNEPNLPLPSPPPCSRYGTDQFQGCLSPLLANQVILGGPLPLRFAVLRQAQETSLVISAAGCPPPDRIAASLKPALPFVDCRLISQDNQRACRPDQPGDVGSFLASGRSPLRFSRNIFCADSSLLFPGMGAAGGALLAWTLLNRLPSAGSKAGSA